MVTRYSRYVADEFPRLLYYLYINRASGWYKAIYDDRDHRGEQSRIADNPAIVRRSDRTLSAPATCKI